MKEEKKIICAVCSSKNEKENIFVNDVFINYTCKDCGAKVFDLVRNAYND